MNEPHRVQRTDRADRRDGPRTPALRWDALGPEVAARLLPRVEELVDDVLATVVRHGAPRDWLEGVPNARHGVESGVRGLLTLIEAGPRGPVPARELYFGFGRGQLRSGRSLGPLLDAYHRGARAAWRALAQAGDGVGLAPETLSALADAIFAYVAEISTASAEGFAYEEDARRTTGRRRELVATLVRDPPPPAPALADALAQLGWRAGAPVAVLAFADARVRDVAARLPAGAQVAWVGELGHALIPDPDAPGRREQLRSQLTGVRAALGPTVPLPAAAASARWARLALKLPGPGLVIAAERRVDLLLAAAPELADALAAEALAPLDALPAAARARLVATLAAWLEHQGAPRPVADRLHVHTQTVRYRLGQLRRLLGGRLDEAEGRLELELALRARRLRPRPARARSAVSR